MCNQGEGEGEEEGKQQKIPDPLGKEQFKAHMERKKKRDAENSQPPGLKTPDQMVEEGLRTPSRGQQGQGWEQGPGQMVPYNPDLVDQSLAKLVDDMEIPHVFMALIKRKGSDQLEPYIKAAGLALKSERKGIQWLETAVTKDPDNPDGFVGACELMPELTERQVDAIKALNGLPESVAKELADKIMRPITGIGTANPQNCRRTTNLREMAETRARVRAQRIHVGYGFTAIEELPPEMTDDERIAKAKNVTPEDAA